MKRIAVLFMAACCFVLPLAAQEDGGFTAMSLNGATGIYVVPTGRVAYAGDSFGFNVGYHTNVFKPLNGDTDLNHLIQANVGFLKMFEVSAAYELQPKDYMGSNPNDFLSGFKFQLPFGSVPIALGASIQYRNIGRSGGHWAAQIYGAVTYAAEIFDWPAETTLSMGHTFIEDNNSSDIDFGMGFDLVILPQYLKSFLHGLIDYANYSYSADPWGADAWHRGVLNLGVRADLSRIPALDKFTFAVDLFVADAFDSNKNGQGRSVGTGVTFGMSF